jgi:hypothetical protein
VRSIDKGGKVAHMGRSIESSYQKANPNEFNGIVMDRGSKQKSSTGCEGLGWTHLGQKNTYMTNSI